MGWMEIREPALITRDDRLFLGSDVFFEIAKDARWARPAYWFSLIPGVRPVCRVLYRALASRRYQISRVCGLQRNQPNGFRMNRWLAMGPLLGGVFVALSGWTGWVKMWCLAGLLWLALKLFLLPDGPIKRRVWWFLWPGTNAREFFEGSADAASEDWIAGVANLFIGCGMFYWVEWAVRLDPMAGAWLGMAAIVFLLHFGGFRLVAAGFRQWGVEARPIMDFPLIASSLSDFWGNRWNRGFNVPARRYLLLPLFRRWGAVAATMTVFAVSGLLHELVISVPAGDGYGLPLAYFLIQGAGVLGERRLRSPLVKRFFALAVVLLPIGLLFHSPFIHNVMLPFLETVGATGKEMP